MSLKTCCLIAGLSLTVSAHAGFYAGLGLGSDTVSFKQSARVYQLGSFDVMDKTHLSGTGIFGTLFGGYGWIAKQFYLAAEANANVSSVVFKSSNTEFLHSSVSSTQYKIRDSLGVSVLPGYFILPATLLYARAGYTNGDFVTRTSDVSLANVSRHLDGFRYGLGLKQAINEKIVQPY